MSVVHSRIIYASVLSLSTKKGSILHLAFPITRLIYFHSAFPLLLCRGSSALHQMQQNVLDASKNASNIFNAEMFYRVQRTQYQTMRQRDYLCASRYSKRPPVDLPWRSVEQLSKTFQHFHHAAAWYDAACPTTLRMAFTQGHCVTQIIYASA